MKEVDPVETVPKARSTPGVEYEGSYEATTYDKFRKRHPYRLKWEGLKLAISEWWCELWSKGLPESDYWERYKELHAGRSILLDTEKVLRNEFHQYWWTTCAVLQRKRQEIEREIGEVKR